MKTFLFLKLSKEGSREVSEEIVLEKLSDLKEEVTFLERKLTFTCAEDLIEKYIQLLESSDVDGVILVTDSSSEAIASLPILYSISATFNKPIVALFSPVLRQQYAGEFLYLLMLQLVSSYISMRLGLLNYDALMNTMNTHAFFRKLLNEPMDINYLRKMVKVFEEFYAHLKLCSSQEVVRYLTGLDNVVKSSDKSLRNLIHPLLKRLKLKEMLDLRGEPLWKKQLASARLAFLAKEYICSIIQAREGLLTYICYTLSTCLNKRCKVGDKCSDFTTRNDIESYVMKLFFREFKPRSLDTRILSETYGRVKVRSENIINGLFSERLKTHELKKLVKEILVEATLAIGEKDLISGL